MFGSHKFCEVLAVPIPKLKVTFVAVNAAPGEPCCVRCVGGERILRLQPPADIEHAERVARFLRDNVWEIDIDPSAMPVWPMFE